ncbi:MMPL family transporter [Planobispora siamensis]|uniref:SSD domain-containing protein n=1 Tax=Planobispora siamensis TaxID=936338 RepID=A0A8J3SLE4_9ACTN|nr:MMPL family transporter [Planobispora siamensis]GIH91738.1 hypothetical protein Psi01_23680 [Planobispora siamensis]
MFESLGRTVYRGRWSLLALGTLFAVLAGYFGLGLFGRMSDGGFDDPGAESTMAAQWGGKWFGGSAPDVVVLYTNPAIDVDDDRFRDAVDAALKALPAEHVARYSTYWSTDAKELASTDRHSTYALISLHGGEPVKQSGYDAIRDRIRDAPTGYVVQIGGRIPLLMDLNTQTGLDLQQAEAISMPVLLVLLVIVFGSLVAAGLPLVVGLLSVIGALALLRLLTEITDVSVFSLNVVTMLGLGLAIDYSLFVLNAFREEIRRETPVETAIVRTMMTAGRTVAFSGLTVATALCGLLLFPQMFLRSIGLGAAAVVLVAMAAALIVLPALLAVLGPKVDAIRVVPDFGGRHRGGTWHAIASSVMRRPVIYLVGVGVLLVALAAPFGHARFGSVDHRVLPEGFESRQVAERIDRDFARNAMSPIDVIVLVERDLVGPMTAAAPGALSSDVGGQPGPVGAGNSGITPVTEIGPLDVKPFADRLEKLDHVTGVDVTGVSQNNGAVRLAVRYDKDPMSDEARALVQEIRDLASEPNIQDVVVGGPTAAQLDLESSLKSTLPWTALIVCLMTGLLLFVAFGSILLPIKAILMNVVSLGASFGVIVWAFQDGHLAGFLGFTPTGSIEATVTVLILAVVFGLSMDYELFLLSRVRAEWLRTGDNTAAVAAGLERTGGMITSAALLLLVVIAAFSTAGITVVKMLGVGMFVAIVVDATLVRALLVPATMRLMGDANWWLPASLRSFHRRIEIREHVLPRGELPPGRGTYVTVEREGGPASPRTPRPLEPVPARRLDPPPARPLEPASSHPPAPASPHLAEPASAHPMESASPHLAGPASAHPMEPASPHLAEPGSPRLLETVSPRHREASSRRLRPSFARRTESPSAPASPPPPPAPRLSPLIPSSRAPHSPDPASQTSASASQTPTPPPQAPPPASPPDPEPKSSSRQQRSNPYPWLPLDASSPQVPANGSEPRPPAPEPVPLPPPAPPRPPMPPAQAVPAGAPTPARKRKKVIKPNVDGPGWHWAEEDEDPSPPPQNPVQPPTAPPLQPLLTPPPAQAVPTPPPAQPVSDSSSAQAPPAPVPSPERQTPNSPPAQPAPPPVRPAATPPVPPPVRPEATPPVPPPVRPEATPPVPPPVQPEPTPLVPPPVRPAATPPIPPPVQPAAASPTLPVRPAATPPTSSPVRPEAAPLTPPPPLPVRPAATSSAPAPAAPPAPPRDSEADAEGARPVRRGPVVSSHLIDQLEPPVRRQADKAIVPITRPPVAGPAGPVPGTAAETGLAVPPAPTGPVAGEGITRAAPVSPEEPVPTAPMIEERPAPVSGERPAWAPGTPPPGKPVSEPFQSRHEPSRPEGPPAPPPMPPPMPPPTPEPVPEPEPVPPPVPVPRREPERKPGRAGGWVAVERRTTRVVRPKAGGAGWEWVEVEEG